MLNIQQNTNHYLKDGYSLPYTSSELLAISLGYKEVFQPRSYNQRYFILNGEKWIHNLEALRHKLNREYGRYITDEELEASEPEGFGYDVTAYFEHCVVPVKAVSKTNDFKELMRRVSLSH